MKPTEFDADFIVRLHTVCFDNPHIAKMKLKGVSREVKIQALKNVVEAYEGRIYGFTQWLTIFVRFQLQNFFHFFGAHVTANKVKGWNLTGGLDMGIVCSELIYEYLLEICRIELMHHIGWHPWRQVEQALAYFNRDTFVPEDLNDFTEIFPNVFEWEER
jgi:hypothetical protein